MEKSFFEELGGTYHEENGYLIPDLRLLEKEENEIGIWGSGICGIYGSTAKLHTAIFSQAAG